MRNRFFIGLFSLAALLIGEAALAAAPQGDTKICLLDGVGEKSENMVDCPKTLDATLGSSIGVGAGWGGVRVNGSARSPSHFGPALTPVDKHGYCRFIDTVAPSPSIFVPFRTKTEWESFIKSAPSYVSNVPCARPYAGGTDDTHKLYFGPTSARPGDGGDSPTAPAPALPYWREGQYWPPDGTDLPKHTFHHTCTVFAPKEEECPGGKKKTVCEKKEELSWKEVFSFRALAFSTDEDEHEVNWIGESKRVDEESEPRPEACDTPCEETSCDETCVRETISVLNFKEIWDCEGTNDCLAKKINCSARYSRFYVYPYENPPPQNWMLCGQGCLDHPGAYEEATKACASMAGQIKAYNIDVDQYCVNWGNPIGTDCPSYVKRRTLLDPVIGTFTPCPSYCKGQFVCVP